MKPPTQPFVARKVRHSLKRVELAACMQLENQKPMIGERLTTLLLETLGAVETGMIVSMMLHIDNDKLMDLIDNPMQLMACADIVRKVLEQSRVEQVRQSDATAAAARQRSFVDEGVQTETRSASSAGAGFGSRGASGIGSSRCAHVEAGWRRIIRRAVGGSDLRAEPGRDEAQVDEAVRGL